MKQKKSKSNQQFKNCHRCVYFWNMTNPEDNFTCGKCLLNNNFIDEADNKLCGDFKNGLVHRGIA